MVLINSSTDLRHSIERVIKSATGQSAKIVATDSVTGGCINSTEVVALDDQRRFFVKSNRTSPDLFAAESKGLAAIASTDSIRVPDVIGIGKSGSGVGFLVLEFIDRGRQGSEFFESFGASLALMHQRGVGKQFGFQTDNHIGSTIQVNPWTANWVEFWAEHRLRYQLKLAHQNGVATRALSHQCENLIARLGQIIGNNDETPCLVHGDLWSGNFMASSEGDPVLVDPAVYFGSREVEFAMTTLFGGFDVEFYQAYNEAWPMADGWEERIEVYKLYHLMNHLNLFGTSYLGGCLEILKKFG